jgi:hypothetical protein
MLPLRIGQSLLLNDLYWGQGQAQLAFHFTALGYGVNALKPYACHADMASAHLTITAP